MTEGSFRDYDTMVAQLRTWVDTRGISLALLDDLSGLAKGHTGKLLGDARIKHFSTFSLFAVMATLGIRCRFEEDPEIVEQMRLHWEPCKVTQKRALRKAPLGKATIARVFPVIAKEMQKRGRDVRNHRLTPAQRSEIARKAGRASGRARLRKGLMEAAGRSTRP